MEIGARWHEAKEVPVSDWVKRRRASHTAVKSYFGLGFEVISC